MNGPIETLFKLTDELLQLMAQENMNSVMRHKHPNDQEVQLKADRRDTEIEIRRSEIYGIMLYISSQN